jgi:hypothetical protein
VAPVPITIGCECGESHKAILGETVTCTCGRVYDTSTLSQSELMGVRRSQLRMRMYTTFGLIFVAGISVIAAATWGMRGLMIALPLSAVLWFRLVGPPLRRRVFRGAGELPRWQLEATRIEPAEK